MWIWIYPLTIPTRTFSLDVLYPDNSLSNIILSDQGRSDGGGGISGYIPPKISAPEIFMRYFFFI